MKIVVGFLRSAEGQAALHRAVAEAKLRDATLLVVHSLRGGGSGEVKLVLQYREEFEALETQLTEAGIVFTLLEFARGNNPAEDLLQAARDEQADLIVIGIRRRSAVGKLVMGSNAQEVLLHAQCPVLAVKADDES